MRGPLIYEAKLDEVLTDPTWGTVFTLLHGGPAPVSDKSAADVKGVESGLELSVMKEGSEAAIHFRAPQPARFLVEIDLSFRPGSVGSTFEMVFASLPKSGYDLRIDPQRETLWVNYHDSNAGIEEELTERIPLDGLHTGSTFKLGVRVDGSSFVVLLGGTPIFNEKHDRLADHEPALDVHLWGRGGRAAVTISAARVFALPRPLYEPTLEAALTEPREDTVFHGRLDSGKRIDDKSAADVRQVSEGLELVVMKGGSEAFVDFGRLPELPVLQRWVSELVLEFRPGSEQATLVWGVATNHSSGHEFRIEPRQGSMALMFYNDRDVQYDPLIEPVPVTGLNAGRIFSVGILIDRASSSFSVLLDGVTVAQGTHEKLAGYGPMFHVHWYGDDRPDFREAAVTIHGVRVYEWP